MHYILTIIAAVVARLLGDRLSKRLNRQKQHND
jgi:hypothetical protein